MSNSDEWEATEQDNEILELLAQNYFKKELFSDVCFKKLNFPNEIIWENNGIGLMLVNNPSKTYLLLVYTNAQKDSPSLSYFLTPFHILLSQPVKKENIEIISKHFIDIAFILLALKEKQWKIKTEHEPSFFSETWILDMFIEDSRNHKKVFKLTTTGLRSFGYFNVERKLVKMKNKLEQILLNETKYKTENLNEENSLKASLARYSSAKITRQEIISQLEQGADIEETIEKALQAEQERLEEISKQIQPELTETY